MAIPLAAIAAIVSAVGSLAAATKKSPVQGAPPPGGESGNPFGENTQLGAGQSGGGGAPVSGAFSGVTPGTPTPGVGFTPVASGQEQLQGGSAQTHAGGVQAQNVAPPVGGATGGDVAPPPPDLSQAPMSQQQDPNQRIQELLKLLMQNQPQ